MYRIYLYDDPVNKKVFSSKSEARAELYLIWHAYQNLADSVGFSTYRRSPIANILYISMIFPNGAKRRLNFRIQKAPDLDFYA